MPKKITAVLIGAGSRGMGYARTAKNSFEELYDIVAVAEPIECRRNYVRDLYAIPEERVYNDWTEVLAEGKIADAAIICTMDRDHFAPTMKAIELGYDIMLEKPIAPTPEECAAITKAANEKGVKVLICHVLRFTPFYCRMKQLILEGAIGDVQVVEQVEHVGLIHQSHSFVRGKWGNSGRASTMLLQKSCHDIDIMQWLIDKKCEKVSSFGSLKYFTEENAPAGAPERCLDGCPAEATCPYHAGKIYIEGSKHTRGWFDRAATKMLAPTEADSREALATTNSGRCVFRCDNDVVDRQVVNMEFEGGIVASFTMAAFNGWGNGRFVRVMGTKGMLSAASGDKEIRYQNAMTDEVTMIPVVGGEGADTVLGGHGGGDSGIMSVFSLLVSNEYDGLSAATIETSCKNHMIVFAAEEAKEKNCVVDVGEFAARYGIQ